MKMVKKILSAGLCAAMMLSSVSVFAEDTSVSADAITIDSVAFSAVEGDDTLVKATVAFTAVDPDEVTVLMATKDAITTDDTDDVMYINQVANPESGVLEFVIEKSRILASTEAEDVNNTTLFVKMGGTDINTMASLTGTISLGSDHIPGDIAEDGFVDELDAIFLLSYLAGDLEVPLNMTAADCSGDGFIDELDAIFLLSYLAGDTEVPMV